jgi:DNA gyrase inhibitor GyrI
LATHDLIFLDIAHYAPELTPPERLRFDAAVVVPELFISAAKPR